MNWQGINKRKFPRANYKCLIRVKGDGREEEIQTFTENIGAGGICVILDREFGLFSKVSLEMAIEDDNDPVFCEGKIVWVVKQRSVGASGTTRYDTGIEFHSLSEKDILRINRIVEHILDTPA